METWADVAMKELDGFDKETETDDKRKQFYRGSGVARAQKIIDACAKISERASKFVRAK